MTDQATMEMQAVSLDTQIQCVAREIAMRKSAYPKWIFHRRLTQQKADAEIAAMSAVLETLKRVKYQEDQPAT